MLLLEAVVAAVENHRNYYSHLLLVMFSAVVDWLRIFSEIRYLSEGLRRTNTDFLGVTLSKSINYSPNILYIYRSQRMTF